MAPWILPGVTAEHRWGVSPEHQVCDLKIKQNNHQKKKKIHTDNDKELCQNEKYAK